MNLLQRRPDTRITGTASGKQDEILLAVFADASRRVRGEIAAFTLKLCSQTPINLQRYCV